MEKPYSINKMIEGTRGQRCLDTGFASEARVQSPKNTQVKSLVIILGMQCKALVAGARTYSKTEVLCSGYYRYD